jgi:rhodanese-related sulfurtransferase
MAPQMFAILAVAAALGFVFNNLSPLGAHSDSTADHGSTAAVAAVETAPHTSAKRAASTVPAKGYQNETLSIRLENSSAPALASAPGLAAPPAAPATGTPLTASPIREVTWAEVKASMTKGGMLMIDARPASNFQAGHIPGAISIPGATSDIELAVTMDHYPKTTPITVYCASTSCAQSHAFAERLVRMGFADVRDMRGGMAEYLQTEKPATGTPAK